MPMTLLAFALPTPDTIGKLAIFLFMLSVLIVIHEGGHFWLARWNGVRVNDFAVGFGPTIAKWTSPKTGTNYRLNALPIGGYCAMQGEDGQTSEAEQQRQFRNEAARENDNFQGKKPWQRLSIVVAGPVANFLLAYAILFFAAITFGVPSPNSETSQVGPITPGSPAQKAGLQLGDQIVAIDGAPYSTGNAVIDKIHASAGKPLTLTISRHGQMLTVPITPQPVKDGKQTVGRIGFIVQYRYERVGPFVAITRAADSFAFIITASVAGLAQLPSHLANVHGVIGMGQAAQQVQDLGWAPYFGLAAQISIGLGILNLLPFPALDGGRGIFILAEMLRGRPVDAEKEALVHVTGFAVLMVLMVFVAFHDILNIVAGKSVFE
jgi:regulator of sigma E protease